MEQLLKQLITELKGFRIEVKERFDRLEMGQVELKEAFRHNATLLTENFTDIRKDLRINTQDSRADVDLLFKEIEGIRRKTNKIEQRLSI